MTISCSETSKQLLGGDNNCCIIVGVDKSNYGFDTGVFSNNGSGGMIVYSNDTNVLYGRKGSLSWKTQRTNNNVSNK